MWFFNTFFLLIPTTELKRKLKEKYAWLKYCLWEEILFFWLFNFRCSEIIILYKIYRMFKSKLESDKSYLCCSESQCILKQMGTSLMGYSIWTPIWPRMSTHTVSNLCKKLQNIGQACLYYCCNKKQVMGWLLCFCPCNSSGYIP